MKKTTLTIVFILAAALIMTSFTWGRTVYAGQDEPEIKEETIPSEEETASEEDAETTEISETILAEMEIFDAIDYSNGNLMSEKNFYSILKEVLALHELQLTPYPGTNGYFYFNYSNLDGVRLLSASRTEEELAADIEQAWADYYHEVEEYAAKKEALKNGQNYEDSEENEESEEDKTEAEEKSSGFDPDKDVENSEDYMISFVLSAGTSEMDQQIMFLVSAIVWCIMNPHYNNTDDAFMYLWRALYTTYGNSNGLSASTIDGIDISYPFTIPGNATEAWLGTDEDTGNFILAITNYAVYDEIIDINATGTANIPLALLTGGIN